MKKNKAYIIIGPQGSGKGTQARRLVEAHGFELVVMGLLLKKQAEKKNALGTILASHIIKGELVPDKHTFVILKNIINQQPNGKIFLFDGFPRSINQAKELDKVVNVIRAIHISIPYEISIKRIAGRRICEKKHEYNIYYVPPKKEGVCDIDGSQLKRRQDDQEEAVSVRLKLYQEVTSPLLDYYQKQGKLLSINGNASIGTIAREIERKLFKNEGKK